ncbi:light-inducible CPRF2-like protein, partial [Trifolium pratense]
MSFSQIIIGVDESVSLSVSLLHSRMLSNRESARRSRRRKQAHLTELETQVSQLRDENSSLIQRLSDVNKKYRDSDHENRVLQAKLETLRAQ